MSKLMSLHRPTPHQFALALSLALAAWPAAQAQTEGAAPAERNKLETVVITAERRVENIKDVPNAVSAISGEKLDVLGSAGDDIRFLAARVPSPDVRYFVMAVIIQRETGGNLAELLGKLAELVRERFKLFAKERVLAAEGKLSAWILTLLPFCVAAVIAILNPGYLKVLFTDEVGLLLVYGALAMMAVGILAMWRIIDIKV